MEACGHLWLSLGKKRASSASSLAWLEALDHYCDGTGWILLDFCWNIVQIWSLKAHEELSDLHLYFKKRCKTKMLNDSAMAGAVFNHPRGTPHSLRLILSSAHAVITHQQHLRVGLCCYVTLSSRALLSGDRLCNTTAQSMSPHTHSTTLLNLPCCETCSGLFSLSLFLHIYICSLSFLLSLPCSFSCSTNPFPI